MACRRFLVGNLITRSPVPPSQMHSLARRRRRRPPRPGRWHTTYSLYTFRVPRSLAPSLAHPFSESLPARDPADFDLAVAAAAAVCALDEF